jgi:hypothetical protein
LNFIVLAEVDAGILYDVPLVDETPVIPVIVYV